MYPYRNYRQVHDQRFIGFGLPFVGGLLGGLLGASIVARPFFGYPGGYPCYGCYPGVGYPGVGYPPPGYPNVGAPGVGYPGVGYPGVGYPGYPRA
jgi:hypothetical protein